MADDKAYDVGYGKPPKHTRFQKGTSGNPKGRPRKASEPDPEAQLRQLFDEPCGTVIVKGKRKKVNGEELMYRGQLAAALKGKVSAAKALLRKYESLLLKVAEIHQRTRQGAQQGILVMPEILALDEWEALAVSSQAQLCQATWDDYEKGLDHAASR